MNTDMCAQARAEAFYSPAPENYLEFLLEEDYVDLYWFMESEREQVWNGARYVYATHPQAVSLNS